MLAPLVPAYNSDLGAPVDLFLDFDGHYQATWGSQTDLTTPVFDNDGDVNSFSQSEMDKINEIWARVSEDFAPFNINVTTVESSVLATGVPENNADGIAFRISIGETWGNSAGGIALNTGFTNSSSNTAYVFNPDKSANWIAGTASHESGHGFGLRHQSTFDQQGNLLNEYNPGDNNWSPIMGKPTGSISTWHNGTSTSATTYQDDLAELTRPENNFGYRADGFGNTIPTATIIGNSGSDFSQNGLIERNDDVDVFQFSIASSDLYRLKVDGAAFGQNIDAVLQLHDASGNLITTADPENSIDAELLINLDPGNYFASVTKTTRYGALGQYSLILQRDPGPQVGSIVTVATTDANYHRVRVGFTNAVDPGTFSASDVSFIAPDQSTIPVTSVAVVPGSNDQQFDVLIDLQTAPDVYQMVIGPNIQDHFSNFMDQDADGIGNETLDDRFTGTVQLAESINGWTFAFGSGSWAGTSGIKVAPNGDIYVVGNFTGTVDFDPGANDTSLTSVGGSQGDGFVARYTRDRQLIWAKRIGGTEIEEARNVDIDDSGNVYVSGTTDSPIVDFGTIQVQTHGGNDGYLAKLDIDGNFLWAHAIGGTDADAMQGIVVTDLGNVVVTGYFHASVDFDPGTGTTALTSSGSRDGYIASFDGNGNFQWVWSFGGTESDDSSSSIAADAADNIYLASRFQSLANFGQQGHTLTSAGSYDGFVAKVDSTGTTQWIRHLSGTGNDKHHRLTADDAGNVTVAGSFESDLDLGPSAPTLNGTYDLYTLRLTTDNVFQWAGQITGSESSGIYEVEVSQTGGVWVTGFVIGTADIDPGPGTKIVSASDEDSFVLKLDDATGSLTWSTQIAGIGSSYVFASDDSYGSLYLKDDFTGQAVLPTGEVLNSNVGPTAYVTRLDLLPMVSVVPLDNHITTENGGQSQFGVVLSTAPTANVTVPITTSDAGEATIDVTSLTFTPSNWNVAQVVTVTGVDDLNDDGDLNYQVVIGAATSSDSDYDGLDSADVKFVNLDNDVTFTPTIVFSDSFENGQWNGIWVEDSQNDWFTNTQRSVDGNYSAEVDGRATDATLAVANAIDMSDYGSAELTFSWYIESSFDGGEYVKLEFWNGSIWNEILSLDGNVDQENAWHHELVQLDSQYLNNDFKFRYRAKVSRSSEDANVDNVVLMATSLAGPPNQSPSITSSENTGAVEDALYIYDVEASDPDAGNQVTFSLDTAPAGMTIESVSGVIQWTPNNSQVGSSSVTVRVQDEGGLFDTQSFNVNVTNVNDAPTITSAPVTTATAESPYSYDAEALDLDTGDTLNYVLGSAPTGMTINSVSGLIQWTPTSVQVGDHTVTVRVQDIGGLFDTQSFSIDVAAVNHSPVITSSAVTAATEDTQYTYDIEATDFDAGDTLTFSLNVAPGGMTIDEVSGLIQWTPNNSQVGSNSVTVRVHDEGGLLDTQSFNVNVTNVNDAPKITSAPETSATAELPYSYDVEALDLDTGDTLNYALDSAPTGMTINSDSGLIQWTPTGLQDGDHAVTVRVDDAAGSIDTQSFVITVDTATLTETVVFSDNFENGQLADNWSQDSQNDWKRATGKKFNGSYAAEVDGSASDATLISNSIDMSGYGSADLTFAWLIEKGFDTNEFLALDFKNDAGQWIEHVLVLEGNVDQENEWHQESVRLEDLPDNYFHSNFQFRFRSTVSSSREDAYVDVVKLTATSSALRGTVFDNNSQVEGLTADDVTHLADWANKLWTFGTDHDQRNHELRIDDLPGSLLGTTSGNTITIDVDAAGLGWFIDSTPWNRIEFANKDVGQRYDLLTVLAHELGHVYEHGHSDRGAMDSVLKPGERFLPEGDALPFVFASNGFGLASVHAATWVDPIFQPHQAQSSTTAESRKNPDLELNTGIGASADVRAHDESVDFWFGHFAEESIDNLDDERKIHDRLFEDWAEYPILQQLLLAKF